MTFFPIFDGTFSTEACAAAGHALLDQLHAEALATIAEIADTWDRPAGSDVTPPAEPTTWSDPETWSVEDDEDAPADWADEDDDVVQVRPLPLPALPPLPTAGRRRSTTERELVLHR